MKVAFAASVKAKFSGFIKASKSGPVIVTKNGKPVAMLLAVQDEDEIERMILAYSPKFQRILRTAEQQLLAGRGIPHKEFWQEIEQGQP